MEHRADSNSKPTMGSSPLTKKEWLLLLLLGAVQFTHILDFMIVMPLGPQYMDKAKMALTPSQFGFMVSAYAFSACICGLLAAWYIDRFDRKTALLFLYAGFAVGTLCCAIAPNYEFLVAARIVTGGFGGVVNAMVLTIIGDLFHDSRRGRAMGVIMSAFSLASIAGVPAGLILADLLGWQAPFAVLGVGSFGVLVGVFLILPPVRGHLGRTYHNALDQFLKVALDPGHLRAYALMTILVLGMFTIVPFMATFLVRNVGCPETDLKYMYLCGGLTTLFTMQGVGWLADRFSKLWLFRILAVLTVIPILLVTNLPPVSVVTMLACTTLFMAVTSARMVPLMALVTACAQPRLRGSFMSVNASVQQMAMGLAAQISSLVIHERADGQLTGFAIVGLMAAATTLLCAYLAGHLRPVVIHALDIPPVPSRLPHAGSHGIQTAAPTEIATRR
jgi:predicted MFS family arabinose efflux permease